MRIVENVRMVEERSVELVVPHNEGEIRFDAEEYEGTLGTLNRKLRERGLRITTSSETASLLSSASDNIEGEFGQRLVRYLDHKFMFTSTGILSLPSQGGILIRDNVVIKDKPYLPRDSLLEELKDKNPETRFVPFGKNFDERYLIGVFGEKGAESIMNFKGYRASEDFAFVSFKKEETYLSALGAGYFFSNSGNMILRKLSPPGLGLELVKPNTLEIRAISSKKFDGQYNPHGFTFGIIPEDKKP